MVREQLAAHPVYKDLRLVIIGDTISQYPAVRQAVIKSRVESVVRFLGFVPFDTLRCFYESAAGFVFPSSYEGFGLPPLEAMACGTPVVTSNVSSLPEVVGDAAILVNPENVFDIARGISDMLLDEELRARMIRRGREQAARFSWNWTARQVLEIYKDVIGQSRTQPPLGAFDLEWFTVGKNTKSAGQRGSVLRYLNAIVISLGCAAGALAQGNYEVQVYGSELIPKGVTMVELHSNITAKGTKGVIDGVLPTHHAVHETLEITHGFNEWFESGFYQFTSIQPDGSWKWVGTHIRPRISIPESYHLPVGLSLSARDRVPAAELRPDTWTWEIRPIVDKKIGRFYAAFNPTLEARFTGPGKSLALSFRPT